MFRKFMMFATGVAITFATCSCDETKGGPTEETPSEPYYLEFVHETDALQEFTNEFEGTYEMILNTNVPKKHLKVYSVENQDWCSADIRKDGGAINITPGFATVSDLEATFVVEVTEYGDDVEPLTFVVRRLYEEITPSLTVKYEGNSLVGDALMIEVPGTAQTLTFAVETNASLWKLQYDNFSDDNWVSVDNVSGRNGETVTVSLSKNDTGNTRNQSFTFSPALADVDLTVTVSVVQKAWSAIESITVRSFDISTMTPGTEVFENNSGITLMNMNTAQTPFYFFVDVVGQGNVEVMFAEPGSKELAYVGPGEWMYGGRKDIDPENKDAGFYYYITTFENPGEARSADAVLTDAAGVELFRFCFTQEGGYIPISQ